MKRWISLVLALTLALSFAVPAAAAQQFSDLPEDYWAYDFMQDLYERGIFTGYSDGTIRPTTTTTVAQALSLFSRFYTLTDSDKEYIYADYGDTVRAILPESTPTVYLNSISVCMAAGIITESELKAYDSLNEKITREELAVYLVRTMQLEDEAHSRDYASLSFTDSEDISSDALFDIDLLVSLGIISGYTDGSFGPERPSTRAVVAKMISLSLSYLETNSIELVIPGYHDLTRVTGLLAGYDAASVSVAGPDGLTRRFNRSSATAVTINDNAGTLSPTYVGSYIALTAQGNDLISAAITYHETTVWVQGKLLYLSSAAATGDYIAVQTASGTTERCTVSSSTVYTQSGVSLAYKDLKEDSFVTICRKNGIATNVYVSDGAETLTATVTSLTYSVDDGLLLVTDEKGIVWSFTLDYSALPEIISGGGAVSLNAISAGDKLTLSVNYAKLTKIEKESAVAEYSGTLNYIGQSASRTEWTLMLSDGSTVTAPLSPGAAYTTSAGNSLTASSIALGDTLTVTTSDGVITKVVRTAQASVSGNQGAATVSITGTVLYVDTAANTILALVDGSPLTLTLSSARLQNTSGATVQLRAVTSGMSFLAYGSYSDTAALSATLVIFN